MRRLISTTLFFIAVGSVAVGCGSGEDDATSASLTKAQFLKEANQVCRDLKEKRRAAIVAWEKEFPRGEVPQEKLDEGLKQIVAPSLRQQAGALDALSVPEGEEQTISRMIANLSEGSSDLAREGEAGVARSALPKFAREATAYGLESCSNI